MSHEYDDGTVAADAARLSAECDDRTIIHLQRLVDELASDVATITAERDALAEKLKQLQHDVLAAWRLSRPKPKSKRSEGVE